MKLSMKVDRPPPHFEIDEDEKDHFLIRVCEDITDEVGGHTATLGWYRVDKTDGAVTLELP